MHHGEALSRETDDASLAEAVVSARFEDLDPRLAALCRYARKLTCRPSAMKREDLDPLYAAGLDDRAVVDANQVVSYFNYANRIAHGLGADLEPRFSEETRARREYSSACPRGEFASLSGERIPWITVDQMREIDRLTIEEMAIDLPRMMENAGRNLAVLARHFLEGGAAGGRVAVLVGPGGNGGGGLVAARHLAVAGAEVFIAFGASPERLSPITSEQVAITTRVGPAVIDDPDRLENVDLVLDALLGYGQKGAPRSRSADLIRWCRGRRVLALDVPSGLALSTGRLHEPHVEAAATLTLALPKEGLRAAPAAVGDLYLADISVPGAVYDRLGLTFPSPFSAGPIVRIRDAR